MNLDRYEFEISKSAADFLFTSKGDLGIIQKAIRYNKMQDEVYNLGFGDVNPISGEIDDTIVTNNGDMTKILATVAFSIYLFTETIPDAWIYVTGSSESRIRLYRMAINKHIQEIEKDFVIYILLEDGEWYPFEPNTNNSAFLIQRKK
jgi:hypothetical protein